MLPLALPPLRAHPSDIPALVQHYVDGFNREFRKSVHRCVADAMKGLETYPWPGNIRELRNAVERAMLLTEGDTLLPDHFPVLAPRAQFTHGVELPAGGIDLEQLERDLVVQALARTGRQPDASRRPARAQSGPDPLSYREVRTEGLAISRERSAGRSDPQHPD